MAATGGILRSRDVSDIHAAMQIFARQNGCFRCDQTTSLACPEQCEAGMECVFEVLTNCQSCPQAMCVPVEGSSSSSSSKSDNKSGPNVGAIAGGVAGGVVVLAVVIFVVWRLCVKSRRSNVSRTSYEGNMDQRTINSEKDGMSRRDHRASVHTVHSVASTVLTRASNIIQIAYIPGVTNRAQPSPGVLVPPVPPIPMAYSDNNNNSTPASPYEDEHFFTPRDLRDSTYSNMSGYSEHTTYARTSYAPRSSIASTIYHKNAAVQVPAQTGMRAKPTVVSVNVKSCGSSTNGSVTPPVPAIDLDKFGRPKSQESTFSVGSTFLSNASAATQGRAQVVKVGSALKNISCSSDTADQSTITVHELDSTPCASPGLSTAGSEKSKGQGPFSDASDRRSNMSSATLGAVIQDATRRAARSSNSAQRDSSPFGDEHATKD